eukprot:7473335-Pyramimonas_sp.AAC.1
MRPRLARRRMRSPTGLRSGGARAPGPGFSHRSGSTRRASRTSSPWLSPRTTGTARPTTRCAR